MLQCDAATINESFKNYYSNLYSTENNCNEEALDCFFGGFNLPTVSSADQLIWRHLLRRAKLRSQS